jgi:hypothetical protein
LDTLSSRIAAARNSALVKNFSWLFFINRSSQSRDHGHAAHGSDQSIRLALETGGDSLATGIKNLIEDMGKGRILSPIRVRGSARTSSVT